MNANLHALPKTALIDSRHAATYLGCSAQWLAVLRMRQAGPAYIKHGAYVRYRVSDLDAWIERHRVNGAVETAARASRLEPAAHTTRAQARANAREPEGG